MMDDDVLPGTRAPQRVEDVLASAAAFARQEATTAELRALLDTALIGLYEQARRFAHVFFVDVPLFVYGSVRGDTAPAIPLAAATSLFFLGLDICDDLADGDLPPHWAGWSASQIQLASLALLATLPQLAIARLDAPAATRDTMQATLARGLLRMIGGQQRDLAATGTVDVRSADVEETAAAKSGEELAIFASLAAQFAAAEPAQVEQYEAMGRALGTASQLTLDCMDVFTSPHSKDLAAGTRTLPITLGLERLTGDARARFLALLDRARSDEAAGDAVRRQLQHAGVIVPCALRIEVYRQRALASLDRAGAREPARARLRALVEAMKWPRPRV